MRVDKLIASLKRCKKDLIQFNKDLPDLDDYALVYSTVADAIDPIDDVLKNVKRFLAEARKEIKKNKKAKKNG